MRFFVDDNKSFTTFDMNLSDEQQNADGEPFRALYLDTISVAKYDQARLRDRTAEPVKGDSAIADPMGLTVGTAFVKDVSK